MSLKYRSRSGIYIGRKYLYVFIVIPQIQIQIQNHTDRIIRMCNHTDKQFYACKSQLVHLFFKRVLVKYNFGSNIIRCLMYDTSYKNNTMTH